MMPLDSLSSRSQRRLWSVFGVLFLLAIPSSATWEEGVASFNAKDYPAAAEAFARLVERSPEAHQAHYMLGQSLLQQKQTTAALRSFEKAIALSSDFNSYRLSLAQTQVALRRFDAALSTLEAVDPKTVKAEERGSFAALLSSSAKKASDLEGAERLVRRALVADGDSVPLHLARASLAEKRNAKAERAEAYARAYLASSKDPALGRTAAPALLNVGLEAEEGERHEVYQRAVEVAAKLVREAPAGDSYFFAGQAALGLRDFHGARGWFEKSLAAAFPHPQARLGLGKALLGSRELEPALEHLDRALEAETKALVLQDIHTQRGSAFWHLNRFLDAAAAYELAGKSGKVKEMNELEAIRLQNVEYDQAKAECAEKERRVAELREENRDLEGTDAWRGLERQMAEIVAGCEQFHDEV